MTNKKIIQPYGEETRLALLEQSIGFINESLKDIKAELKDLKSHTSSQFRWTLTLFVGLYVSFAGALIGIILKSPHLFS